MVNDKQAPENSDQAADEVGSTQPPSRRRWVMPVLMISLCLNLLIASMVAGFWLRSDGPRLGPWSGIDRIAVFRMMRSMEGEDRELAREIVQSHRPKLRESNQEMKAARRELAVTMTAQPFDADAFAQAIANSRHAEADNRDLVDEILVEIASKMDQEGREKMADGLLRGKRGDRTRHHHGADKPVQSTPSEGASETKQ